MKRESTARRMRSLSGLLLGCAVGTVISAQAAAPQMDDYAQGITIAAQAERPLIEVDIPDIVYRTVTQADLSDVSVFNAEGAAVPHAVCAATRLAAPLITKEALPVFMLQATAQSNDSESRIDLNTPRGTSLRIEESPSQAPALATPQTRAHVIDARAITDPLRAVQFEWRSPDDASEVHVRIEASDDLDHWHTVVEASTLLQVEQGDRQLRREAIRLPERQYRFLRVARADGGPPLSITSVLAERVTPPATIDPVWFTADPQTPTSQDEWLFDAARLAPVTYARLRFPQDNVSVRVRIQSRGEAGEQWHERWSGESYALVAKGERRLSAPARFDATHDRYWRVVPTSSGTVDVPTLELAYRPARLQFLTQGHGPYTLAFASRRVQSDPARPCGSLIGDVQGEDLEQLIGAGSLGAQRTLGGDAALQSPPQPTPVKRIALWAVLVGGVTLLVAMALTLLKRVRPT